MEPAPAKRGMIQGVWQKIGAVLPGQAAAAAGAAPPDGSGTHPDALGTLEALQAGRRPDYCLYVGPTKVAPLAGGPDVEDLLARGFAPLPVVPLDGYRSPLRRLPTDGRLADEAFAALATHARVLLVVPTDRPEFVRRARWLRDHGHLWRGVFLMPPDGALGTPDWAAAWDRAASVLAPAGLDLPPYTAGGWLFRYAVEPSGSRAATFRLIVHPNPDKIAKALDAICEEMTPG